MGIYLRDHDHDCLTNLRFADDVLLFATSKEQLQKMLHEIKESTEKVGLKIHPGKTNVPSNQCSLCSDTKKQMQIDDIKIEILTRSESVRYLGQLITFQQVQTGIDIEKLHAQTSSPTVRRSSNSDDVLRIWNVGTHQRARKNDTTQHAPSHHTNKKKIQKDRETQS